MKLEILIKQNHIYLWPGERSLVAKVEDEAGVHDVLAAYPGHGGFNKTYFVIIS